MKNTTWVLEELPLGKKPIGFIWDYKMKCKMDGSLDKHRARMVAKEFSQ